MRLLSLLVLWASLQSAQAQPVAPGPAPAASRWNVGLQLGTGASYYSSDHVNQAHPWTSYSGGLTGGYSFPAAGGFLNLQAGALLQRRAARPWQSAAANNAVLFVPFYLRTDRPVARVHLLLGGGPTFWLTGRSVPAEAAPYFATHPVELTGLLGCEVRLLPLGFCETTVAVTYRPSLTPSLVNYHRSAGGQTFGVVERHSWFGATLNVYLHPAARR